MRFSCFIRSVSVNASVGFAESERQHFIHSFSSHSHFGMTSRSRSRHRKRRREYTVDTDSFGRRSSRRSFRRSNYQYSHQSNHNHRSFYYQNNYYPVQYHEASSYTHFHRHSHNHHHYHHHHHHNQGRGSYGYPKRESLALSHGRRSDRKKLSHKTGKRHESISSGFSDGNESEAPPDDLEGTVDLKGLSV